MASFGVTVLWPAAAAVSLALGVTGDVSVIGLALTAIATAGAYAFDRLRDDGPNRVLVVAVVVSAAACGVLLLLEPWRLGPVALLAALALGYVPLKRVVPKNLVAAVAWTVAVVVLPRTGPPPGDGSLLTGACAVAMVMFANTTLCDVRTIDEDRQRGIRSVSVCFGERVARVSATVAAIIGLALAPAWGLATCAVGHAMLALLIRNPRRPADALLLLAWMK